MATKKSAARKPAGSTKKASTRKSSQSKKPAAKKSKSTLAKAGKAVGQAAGSVGSAIGDAVKAVLPTSLGGVSSQSEAPFIGEIEKQAKSNDYFRQVLYTTELSQLVLMTVPVGGEIGSEVHNGIDQVLTFVEGEGKAVLNNRSTPVGRGTIVVVPAGTQHNFINTGNSPLKLYTVYAPPEHEPGTVHRTKAEADAAEHH